MEVSLSQNRSKKNWLYLFATLAIMTAIVLAPDSAWCHEQKASKDSSVGSAGGKAQETTGSLKTADVSQTGRADNGKKLFMADGCFECHGTVGQGSTSTGGTRIGPPAIPFDVMVQYVRQPSGQMPPYTTKVISDHDLADIYAYLKSQPKARPAKDLILLNQ